jgi:uncharacterized membrane protein
VLLVGFAVSTVVLSWTVVNAVFTLRYADQHFGSGAAGIAFGDSDGPEAPTYRDFAYVVFTIGMCYQVSDTTVRDRRIQRTVFSRPSFVRVRCGDRRGVGEPHRWPDSLMRVETL